ncbi:hypothetical protein QQY66_01165 [Streptomyces sp. DG2A-72]|uniref:hypothetical protein n=1 Tax=Streptomyces sp. DG2A-72 TaxID=3051386 RepID=UPI00265B782F|nr:hypothetical protein [Streptomyces sp. DG2A-72]MDO0930374.1 hypothetical protein [Streptomyces sp. DG2A-72]
MAVLAVAADDDEVAAVVAGGGVEIVGDLGVLAPFKADFGTVCVVRRRFRCAGTARAMMTPLPSAMVRAVARA